MKTKNSKLYGSIAYINMITVFIAATLIFSCKKDPDKNTVIQSNMIEAAKKTGSKVLCGNVAITTEANLSLLKKSGASKPLTYARYILPK